MYKKRSFNYRCIIIVILYSFPFFASKSFAQSNLKPTNGSAIINVDLNKKLALCIPPGPGLGMMNPTTLT